MAIRVRMGAPIMSGYRWFLLPFLICGAWHSPSFGTDQSATPRKITKEPVYQNKSPRYGLLAFGKEGKDQVWIVHDGDVLYVDRNGNGDLTEPGERIERQKPRKGFEDASSRTFEVGELKLGGLTHKGLTIYAYPIKEYASGPLSQRAEFKEANKEPEAPVYRVGCEVEVPGIKGGGQEGRLHVMAGISDAQGFLMLGKTAASASVIRMGGPIQVDFPDLKPKLRPGYAVEVMVSIGFPGQGPGTFAAISYEETFPAEVIPTVEVEVASAVQGMPPYREKFELPSRC